MSETGSSLSVLSGLLDSLGSALKSHIMSDLNAWEDRRRSEAQTSRGKKSAHKRPRLQPMPELSPHTLADMRRMRHALYGCQTDQRDTVGAVAAWAIGVLALSVSLADMKGNFNLNDLLSLPSTKAAFHLLLLAIETSFTYQPVEDAEAAFIDRVLATTNDPRAVGWILSQYGCVHSMTFPRCLQIYAIARLAKPQAAGLEASGLAQAVSDLNSAHPENATRVLDGILSIYCSTVAEVEGNPAMLSDIPIDDSRRYILFYLLQAASRQSKSGPLLLSTGEHQRWLASAIKFEMRLGFSQFHHLSGDDSVVALHPLADAVDVLYVDMLAGRPKKPSDQPLDIDRALDAFALIGAVVRGHRSDLAGDVDMDDSDLVSFVDLCHSCLVRLLSREQTIIVLTHMPRTVKNMPQPIPNGLQEAVQKGGRSYNNGPIALPPVEQAELDALSRKLLDVMASAADLASPIAEDSQDQSKAASPAADRLYEMVCDTAPMLIEVLVSRMADTPDAAKVLVRRLVDTWSISRSNEPADSRSVRARYRALLAISESSRGSLHRQLLDVFESSLTAHPSNISLRKLRQMVELLSTAAIHHHCLYSNQAVALPDALVGVREVVGDLCSVLDVCWRKLWIHSFGSARDRAGDLARTDASQRHLQVTLVKAICTRLLPTMGTASSLRSIDCLVLVEHAARELVQTQRDIIAANQADSEHERPSDYLLELARALLALITTLANNNSGVGRVAMEKLLRLMLLPASSSSTTNTDESQLNAVFEISDDDERDRCISKEAKFGDQAHCGDSAVGLDELLEGAELPRAGSRAMRGEVSLAKAEHFIWQNAVRPMPRYPRSGMRDYDRTKDARAFVRATSNKPIIAEASCGLDLARPLLAFGLLSLAHVTPVGIPTLCELLEEYYVDCLPSMPPALLDERLNSGARLQLRAIEMEFLQDTKETPDLELLVLELIRIPSGANAAKRMVSALLASLVVLWNGALGQPTSKRASDLAFTTRFVAHVLEAYGGDERSRQVCRLFPLISGGDLARLLHQYVWRWIVYRMPGAQDESHKLLLHIMRRYVVVAAPLFKHFVVDA
ncbi:hypothetical protein EV174_003731 [Coemansia sp. RSA 2320]|nr:hypothetical protein EV174_003731 [Coemansia sp. RSA 2320]